MRPVNIPADINRFLTSDLTGDEMCLLAYESYQRIKSDDPEISIVMPAYNEAENIVPTLTSLCCNITDKRVEIIVVNNNSKDNTEELVKRCGVNCVFEIKQGIAHARTAGLKAAKGKYILNADADTLYPKDWINLIVKPLVENERIAMTYGKFSFIPVGNTGRLTYFIYEYLADFTRWLNKYIKDEAVNVYGFTSAIRKEQALDVNGFEQPPGTVEDGYMAFKLRNRGYGRLYNVTNRKALVWTTDRRMQLDGGFVKGTWRRIKRVFFKGER
ncbi:MAG: glycosyltransferase family 2 protein [Flavobacterium sp.]|nr:MAG: glycosyltransferase family 2 protein [Flavobacterium sp.]